MTYSLLAGGKRLRPLLVLEGARICGGVVEDAIPAAVAVEYIHTYSLIHDDLPAMDNDDLRRGLPTSHRKFNESTAILAGDALLTDAFALVASCAASKRVKPENALKAVAALSKFAGSNGMVGGQMADTLETTAWRKKSIKSNAANLHYIHVNKTAALLRASLLAGAHLSGAGAKQLKALDTYGLHIGVAFQIADDILDVVADKKLLGKNGSDKNNNKLTYVSLYGLDKARKDACRHIAAAKNAIALFGEQKNILSQLAEFIIDRKY
jgi:geranylgeranyl diphosphate synthase type II